MIDVMSVCSEDASASCPEDEVRNSVFGGSELESESCGDGCGPSRPPLDTSRVDPVRFYEDSELETEPTTPSCPVYSDLSLANFIADLYSDRRRQTRVQSLDDIVLLFAIPLRKRDGSLNKQWKQCELRPVYRSVGGSRSLSHRFDDPINGDRVFAYVCPVSPDKPDDILNFVIASLGEDDVDTPRDGYYSLPMGSPGIFSLRDGVLAPGDRIHDMGIILYLESSRRMMDDVPPILHFYDEVTGVWTRKAFRVTSQHGSWVFQAVLASCRRTLFVVEGHPARGCWLRDRGRDFCVAWPGTYVLSQGGELRMLEKAGSSVGEEQLESL